MRLESVRDLKYEAINLIARELAEPRAMSAHQLDRGFDSPLGIGISLISKEDFTLSVHIKDKSYYPHIERLRKLAGQELDVQITGDIFPLCGSLSIGASISHCNPLLGSGSLGCFVRKRNDRSGLFILSNNHVIANCNNANIGDSIAHPDMTGSHIASLSEFIPLNADTINTVDAAIAKVESEHIINIAEIPGFGSLNGYITQNNLVEQWQTVQPYNVVKKGRTTNLTWGTLRTIEFDEPGVRYSQQMCCPFTQLMVFEGVDLQPFSQPGDSGSIIVNQAGMAIALIFAGTQSGLTYAIPIDTVLKQLNIEIATEF